MLAAGVLACSDSSAPSPRIDVSVQAQVIGAPQVTLNEWNESRIECRVSLLATARGTGAAVWETATVQFAVSGSPSQRRDTVILAAGDVAAIWTTPEIGAGEVQQAELAFGAPRAFSATMAFAYRSAAGGEPSKADAAFSCG